MTEEQLPLIFLIAFGVITFLELLYYFAVFSRFSFATKKSSVPLQRVPVSVIMVVKDSANAMMKTLNKLLAQQYPLFEIVIVNDRSADETGDLIMEYQNKYPNVKAVNLDSAVSTIRGKKFALSLGIRCATYEHLLFVAPECCPNSVHWLDAMARHFTGKRQIVLGYCTYERSCRPRSLCLHFDCLVNAMQYFSFSLMHSAYRGDGRNLAYTRPLFNSQKGFATHNHIRCGEDDIFIGRAATRDNCAIEYEKDSVVTAIPPEPYKDWKYRKKGYYFTRQFYSFRNRFLLNGYALVNLFFYILFGIALAFSLHNAVFLGATLGIFALRLLCEYVVFGFAADKLNERQVLPGLLLFDLLFAVVNPFCFLTAKMQSRKYC